MSLDCKLFFCKCLCIILTEIADGHSFEKITQCLSVITLPTKYENVTKKLSVGISKNFECFLLKSYGASLPGASERSCRTERGSSGYQKNS